MHKFAMICLAGALCFSFSGIRAEASSLSLGAEEGIASVMTEAQAVDPEADEKVLEDMAPSEFDGICIAQVNDYVNVRSEANTTSSVVTSLANGDTVEVLGDASQEWVQIRCTSKNNEEGYVKSEYLVAAE